MKTMRSTTRLATAAVAASLILAASGCGLSKDDSVARDSGNDLQADSIDAGALDGVKITVGSKEFDEQLILGQLTVQILKLAGADVTDDTNTKGSTQVRNKLVRGTDDVYWDYTGTGWITYLGNEKPIQDAQEQYDAVAKEDLAKNDLFWGPLAPFNNTYAFATTDEFAQENDLATHSDMAAYIKANPDSTVCTESEFAARPDGLEGFKKAYGITGGDEKSLGTGVVYTQTDKGGCDFGEVFTTDGRIAALGLTVLDDDKAFFPLYNGVPVAQASFNSAHPEMMEVLKPLADSLTTEVMQKLNTQVSAEGRSPEKVAADYLKEAGFAK